MHNLEIALWAGIGAALMLAGILVIITEVGAAFIEAAYDAEIKERP